MRFLHDRRGNVALMFGLAAIPLIGLGGLAIDFGHTTETKTQFDSAADAAALLAITNASNAYLAHAADPIGPAKTAATQRFIAQAGAQWTGLLDSVTITIVQNGTQFTSDVKYTAVLTTTLSRVIGVGTLPVAGESKAAISIKPYVDIQLLMDASSSMAIAATDNDIAAMKALSLTFPHDSDTPSGVHKNEACGFACHWTSTGNDYYKVANANGVQLRINVLRAAAGNLITSISGYNTSSLFRIGLYTFAQSLTSIYALSGNIDAAQASLPGIQPDVNPCTNNCPDTNVPGALSSLAALTTVSGDGSSQAKSQKFLFIVSDGVIDANINGNRTMRPVSAADCAPMKALGVTVMTLYTPYLPLTDNSFYNTYIAPFQSQIGPGLQACASDPTLYYETSATVSIDAQLQKMLASVLQTTGHLTK